MHLAEISGEKLETGPSVGIVLSNVIIEYHPSLHQFSNYDWLIKNWGHYHKNFDIDLTVRFIKSKASYTLEISKSNHTALSSY